MTSNKLTKNNFTEYGAIVCALVTASIHIYLSFQFVDSPDPIFLSNGLGYLFLVAVLYLPSRIFAPYRGVVRWILMGYAALTIVLWVFWGARTTIGYLDKLVEIALILFLWLDHQHSALKLRISNQ